MCRTDGQFKLPQFELFLKVREFISIEKTKYKYETKKNTVELMMKLHLLQWNYFLDWWNIMDYHLVVLGFVDLVVSLLFDGDGDMKVLIAFRMLRMLRVVWPIDFFCRIFLTF